MAALRFSTLTMSEETQKERCVADATILHDLDHTGLISGLLDSDVDLITTPTVLSELEPGCRHALEKHSQSGQVAIEMATTDDMNQLINEVGPANHMSVNDRFLCRIARRLNTSLLSGCELLSREAEKRGIRARSITWVFNRLVNNGVLNPVKAAQLLGDLQQRSPWMNKERTRQQIERWQLAGRQGGLLTSKAKLKLHSN